MLISLKSLPSQTIYRSNTVTVFKRKKLQIGKEKRITLAENHQK